MIPQSYLKVLSIAAILGAAIFGLSGCATVSMPNIDFLKLPEFREDANNIEDYPQPSEAPLAPTDVRSATAWDQSAKAIIAEREAAHSEGNVTDAPFDGLSAAEQAALKSQVRAYKLDDPQ